MKKLIKSVRLALTFILLILSVFAFAAGTDIYHNLEPDLSQEWLIFNLFFYLCCFYIVVNLVDLFIKEKNNIPRYSGISG